MSTSTEGQPPTEDTSNKRPQIVNNYFISFLGTVSVTAGIYMPQSIINDFHNTQNNIPERYVKMPGTSNPEPTGQSTSQPTGREINRQK